MNTIDRYSFDHIRMQLILQDLSFALKWFFYLSWPFVVLIMEICYHQ